MIIKHISSRLLLRRVEEKFTKIKKQAATNYISTDIKQTTHENKISVVPLFTSCFAVKQTK